MMCIYKLANPLSLRMAGMAAGMLAIIAMYAIFSARCVPYLAMYVPFAPFRKSIRKGYCAAAAA